MKIKISNFTLCLIMIFMITGKLFSQITPHPELLKKIGNGEIDIPYALKNINEIKSKGVDAGWADKELIESKNRGGNEFHRQFGPVNVLADKWNALVLLVEFSDKHAKVDASYFDELIFGQSELTLNDYFKKVSYGNLDIVTVDLPGTVGWLNVSQSYSYYCDGQNGFGDYPKNAQKLVEEVVVAADPSVDFSKYDNDGDGYVDALFVVHTGRGAEMSGNDNDIWSHAWSVQKSLKLDGVKIQRYSMEPEYWRSAGDMTIGVYCHELGHAAFGLPDVYDTDYTSAGVGTWSLMAGGSWNGSDGDLPAFPDAWNHIQMGFIEPKVVNTNVDSQEIQNVETYPEVYLLWQDGVYSNEYFLVENRQKIGYDTPLTGSGLLVYHIDENKWSNDDEWYPGENINKHYLVALEQADGQWNLENNRGEGDDGDPFPGSSKNHYFNDASLPNSDTYSGVQSNVAINNVSESALTMTADFRINTDVKELYLLYPVDNSEFYYDENIGITWFSNQISNVNLEYSYDNGVNWSSIASQVDADMNEYVWNIPEQESDQCIVRLYDSAESGFSDQNENPIFINIPPGVTVVYPDGGEEFEANSDMEIEWSSVSIDNVTILYSTNNGINWSLIKLRYAADAGKLTWKVPDISSNECIIKVAELGNVDVSDVSNSKFSINTLAGVEEDKSFSEYSLDQNYPNPFNASTKINFQIPGEFKSQHHVSLKIYDVLGREVQTLFEGYKFPGENEVYFDGSDLPSGVYFCRMQAQDFVQTIKVVLLR